MDFKLILLPEAFQDIKEIIYFYKSINLDLAKKFNIHFKDSVTIIKNNPFIFQIKYDKFYVCKINKFPYLIHFGVNHKIIIINAIIHTSRNSKICINRE